MNSLRLETLLYRVFRKYEEGNGLQKQFNLFRGRGFRRRETRPPQHPNAFGGRLFEHHGIGLPDSIFRLIVRCSSGSWQDSKLYIQ